MISANPNGIIHCKTFMYLIDIAEVVSLKSLTFMADLSSFRTSEFLELSMTYHNPRSALPNDDITNFPRLELDR